MTLLARLTRRTEGQDLAEYGIALAIIGAGTAIVALIINGPVITLWNQASGIINTAV